MNGKIKKRIAALNEKSGVTWTVKKTNGKHLQLVSPFGLLFMAKTPSDRRADMNLMAVACKMVRSAI